MRRDVSFQSKGLTCRGPTDLAVEAYERALEPKHLAIVPGGHFDAYTEPGFNITSGAAVEWFKQHLG